MVWITKKPVNSSLEDESAPRDTFNLAYFVYFALGTGVLLPWNSFITAVDYFSYLYPEKHIDRVFGLAYCLPSLISLSFLTVYGQRYSSWARINCGLSVLLFTVFMVPVTDAVFITEDSRGFAGTFYSTVGALLITGIADAAVQGSLVGTAGQLPERYMQALVSGTAASGVLVSFLRIITKASLPQTPWGLRVSANIYFIVCATFMVFCIVSYNLVHKLPVISYYKRQILERAKLESSSAETESLTTSGHVHNSFNNSHWRVESQGPNSPSTVLALLPSKNAFDKSSYKIVLAKVKWLAGSLVLIYVLTLSLYPGFVSEDVHSPALGDWYPVLLITSYNVFDLVGKTLTAFYIPDNTSALIWGTLGRLLFIPLFASCLHGPGLFRTEAPVFLLTALLGATNGYLTSCVFVVSPKTVPLAEAETAGIVMTMSLMLGLAIGSIVSWFWVV